MFNYSAHGLIESTVKKKLPGGGPQTVGEVLSRQLSLNPGRDALVGRSGRYSYAALDEKVSRAVHGLHKLGVRRYDRIAACLPNDVDIVVALLACARLGAIWVGVNKPLAIPEKVFILQDCGAAVFLVDPISAVELHDQLQRLPKLREMVIVDAESPDSAWHTLIEAANPESCPVVAVDPFEPAAIAYTSGTTGRPKGAVHSHHNILLPGAIEVAKSSYGSECPQGVMLPLTILNLMVLAPMVAFQDGSCCVCMDCLKPEDVARWVRDERVGHFASVPTVIQDLLTSPLVMPEDLATLGHPDIGGAGCAEEVQALYLERFGRRITVAYGMTEAPTIITRTDPSKAPEAELCGRAVEQLELVVVDDNDNRVSTGSVGEICVKPADSGPYAGIYTTMLGYWNKPEATASALSGGIYHTGDMGYLDEQQQLYLRGRQNDLIIRGGANIYPLEVERVLLRHPGVADAAVLGVDDVRLGQRVVVAVELTTGRRSIKDEARLAAEIQSYCEQHLARYKVPANVKFVDSLPRNAMNKVIKPQLLPLF